MHRFSTLLIAAFLITAPGCGFMSQMMYWTGGNPVAARSAGIDTARVKFRCFVAMGGLVGLAAALLFGRVGLAPLNAGVNLELQVIAAIIVGGGLADPVLQAGPADAQVFGELDERFVTLARELDRAAPELWRVR